MKINELLSDRAILQELGERFGRIRLEHNLTQAELAERVGLRYYTFVSQVESGLGRVPIETQGAWAEAVGLNPAEFARTLLRYYEPELFRLLFGEAAEVAPVARLAGRG